MGISSAPTTSDSKGRITLVEAQLCVCLVSLYVRTELNYYCANYYYAFS